MKRAIIIVVILVAYAVPARAFETGGFTHPYGVAVDPRTGYIYVSNMNGPGEQKDDNGFISRLKPDGAVDLIKYIDGIQGMVELNAPKGMAIIGNFLYVADIDAVRVFDLTNASSLFTVNFGTYKVEHFYDLAIGPDGALYVTEGPTNTVYRIDVMNEHRVTPFIQDDALGQPHGIAWFSNRQVFLVGGWKSGQVMAFDRTGKKQQFPAIYLEALEGIAADTRGNAYVSSTSMNAVYRMSVRGALFPFAEGIHTPLGITYQGAGDAVLAVSYRTNSLNSFPAAK